MNLTRELQESKLRYSRFEYQVAEERQMLNEIFMINKNLIVENSRSYS